MREECEVGHVINSSGKCACDNWPAPESVTDQAREAFEKRKSGQGYTHGELNTDPSGNYPYPGMQGEWVDFQFAYGAASQPDGSSNGFRSKIGCRHSEHG